MGFAKAKFLSKYLSLSVVISLRVWVYLGLTFYSNSERVRKKWPWFKKRHFRKKFNTVFILFISILFHSLKIRNERVLYFLKTQSKLFIKHWKLFWPSLQTFEKMKVKLSKSCLTMSTLGYKKKNYNQIFWRPLCFWDVRDAETTYRERKIIMWNGLNQPWTSSKEC